MKSNLLVLTQAMFRNDETLNNLTGSSRTKKHSFFSTRLGSAVLILGLALLMGFSMGTLVVQMYDALSVMEMQSLILRLLIPSAGIMVFMFGLFSVMNIFYFSRDVDNYLYLPVKAGEILSAKFLVSLIYEYFIILIFFLPMLTIYGVKDSAGILYFVYMILALLLIPVFPLVVASALAMVVMRFSNKFKNRDRFNMIAGILSLFMALGFNFGIQYLAGTMSEGSNPMIGGLGDLPLFKVTGWVFPTSHYALEALISPKSGILHILIMIGITAAALVAFYFLGNALYFKGVTGISESQANRKVLTVSELKKGTSKRSVLFSYSLKELKLVYRTPVYFLNCILISLIYPLFFLIPMLVGSTEDGEDIKTVLAMAKDVDKGTLLMIILGAAFTLASLNIISSTAISREGKNFYVIKYIPVSYMQQIYAKILSSFYVEVIAVVIFYGLIFALIPVDPLFILGSFVLVVLASITINQLGILLDVLWPKLNWDMEQKAVKQNLNSMIHMFLGFGLTALCVFLGIKFTPTPFVVFMAGFLGLLILVLLLHFLLKRVSAKRFAAL